MNLAKAGLLLKTIILLYFVAGCSPSAPPKYQRIDISDSIINTCKEEHNLDVKVRLVGKTLYIYLPLENILTKSDKPEKYTQSFDIEYNDSKQLI